MHHKAPRANLSCSTTLCLLTALSIPAVAHATPSREWGTYFGGSSLETAEDVDFTSGYVIDVVGRTSSAGLAAGNPHDGLLDGPSDAYLAQFDQSGARVWATYYGGTGDDQFRALVHDDDDNIYAFGDTTSVGFIATPGAHQTSLNGSSDAMLVKFDTSGARQWGTFFGGNGSEQARSVCGNAAGTTYIVGQTDSSTGLATATSHDHILGGADATFLAKFSAAGVLQWATYFEGINGSTYGFDCAVDSGNNVYITGYTNADGLATPGAHDTSSVGTKAFLTKFSSGGTPVWSTYYGGLGTTHSYSVGVDSSNNVYIGGWTASTGSGVIATAGLDTSLDDGVDAFVAKFNSAGVRQWGTYFGGSNGLGTSNVFETFFDIDVADGMLYLSGLTDSTTGIATTGAWGSTNPTNNLTWMYVMLTTSGSAYYASYHGGSLPVEYTGRPGVAVSHEGLGRAAIVGATVSSSGVATTGTHDTSYNGGGDAAITYVHLFDL